jgi:hypothetical protein
VVGCWHRVAVAVGMLPGCIVRAGRSKVGARARDVAWCIAASPAVEQTWRRLSRSRKEERQGAWES